MRFGETFSTTPPCAGMEHLERRWALRLVHERVRGNSTYSGCTRSVDRKPWGWNRGSGILVAAIWVQELGRARIQCAVFVSPSWSAVWNKEQNLDRVPVLVSRGLLKMKKHWLPSTRRARFLCFRRPLHLAGVLDNEMLCTQHETVTTTQDVIPYAFCMDMSASFG